MNERIKQLAIYVVDDYTEDDYWPFFTEELEEFAKLIIDECITACATERLGKTSGAAELIKERFGITE